MDDPCTIDRRGFLQATAAATAAAAVGCGRAGRWRALTDAEAVTLAAACDQIVPPDDFPGAAEAGAVDFVDRQLATRASASLESWRAGLRALEESARRRHARAFAQLLFEEQTALLRELESGAVDPDTWSSADARHFFDRLVAFTMMGYYGDPRHGGNRERVSWRMLDLPDPPIRGRHRPDPESRS